MMLYQKRNNRSAREAGFALPTVLLALAVLAVLGVGAFTVSRDEFKSSDWMRESAQTMYAAEAGVNHVFAKWDSAGYSALMPSPGDSADLGWITIPENGASFHAVLRRIDNGSGDKKFAVAVTGRGARGSAGIRRTIIAQARETAGGASGLPYVVVATEKTKSSGGTHFGDVYSNADIETGGGGIVGNATAAGIVSDPSLVTGTVTEGAPPLPLDTIPCPVQPYGPEPLGDYGFDPVKGTLTVSGFVTIPEGTYLFNQYIQSNGGTTIPAGDNVIIYIEKRFSVSNGFVNNTAPNAASNLQIIQCGALTGDWKFSGDTDVQLGMYAPWSKLSMTGAGDRYGTFWAWQLDKTGSGNTYYQPSLSAIFGGNGSSSVTRVANSWWEVAF